MNSLLHTTAIVALGIPELIIIALVLGLNGLWIWSLVHCCINRRLTDKSRIIGIVLIVLLHIIGSIIYLFLPRVSSEKG